MCKSYNTRDCWQRKGKARGGACRVSALAEAMAEGKSRGHRAKGPDHPGPRG